jgi:hypothetical protein
MASSLVAPLTPSAVVPVPLVPLLGSTTVDRIHQLSGGTDCLGTRADDERSGGDECQGAPCLLGVKLPERRRAHKERVRTQRPP